MNWIIMKGLKVYDIILRNSIRETTWTVNGKKKTNIKKRAKHPW